MEVNCTKPSLQQGFLDRRLNLAAAESEKKLQKKFYVQLIIFFVFGETFLRLKIKLSRSDVLFVSFFIDCSFNDVSLKNLLETSSFQLILLSWSLFDWSFWINFWTNTVPNFITFANFISLYIYVSHNRLKSMSLAR